MPSVAETIANNKPPLGAALEQGVRTLSANQTLDFSLYQRYVFPLDGMNYWFKVAPGTITTPGVQVMPGLATQTAKDGEAIQVSPGGIGSANILGGVIINPVNAIDQGLENAESLFVDFTGPAYSSVTGSTVELEPGESIDIPVDCISGAWVCAASGGHQFTCILEKSVPSVEMPTDVQVVGSLHYASEVEQREDATVDSNTVIFTSLSEIQPFNQIGPDHMYICHYRDITFAFSSRGRLYGQADLYHYAGKALYSVNDTQIIDDPSTFNPKLIVSNSLPIWLNMANYVPPYPGFTCPIRLYPSFLVDDNLVPPFGSVHIEGTETLVMGTVYSPTMSSDQLCKEKVKVHLYGVDNDVASTFVSFVEQYSLDWMNLGLSDTPAIRDEKHRQPEFKILAQYKTVEFEINYLQSTSRNMARQLIKDAVIQNQWQYYTDPLKGDNNAANN